jgi:hypothetical protein
VSNAGAPAFGKGQIEGWAGTGDALERLGEYRRKCRFVKSGVLSETEQWVTDELRVEGSFEPPVQGSRKTPLTVPWNFELLCVENEGLKSALVRIGVPNGAPPPPAECESEAARAEEVAGEESRREGCFATTVPEGCMKLTEVVWQLGLEHIYEGALQLKYANGFANGLHSSTWVSEGGAAAGKLHLRGNVAATFHVAPLDFNDGPSVAKIVGFGAMQLITAK